jgi:hypothetical protein
VQFFEDLASELHSVWMRHGRDELAFPELAQLTLERYAPAAAVAPDDIFRWLVKTDRLPRQFDLRSNFGNFAITVVARDDFHIDALVWTDSTTSIHQHGFSGAFHVLQGSSLHALWSFQESRRWSDRLKRGRLAVRTTERLQTGSTRPILPGAGMIHSLFHLEAPSMTVVVRTPSSAVVSPQLSYERSGLAYDPHFELGRVEKVRQLLRMLWESDHPQQMALSEAALRGVDAHSAARIISSMRSQTTIENQSRLIDLLAVRDAELAMLLRETVRQREQDRQLVELRKQTRSPRHRMLLALLLNLPDRPSIDHVLRQIAPDEAPEDWLWDTIRSMHDTPGRRHDRMSVLGFSLNEASEQTLKMLLCGYSVAEVSKAVAGDAELEEDVRALCSTLSTSPVLGPLLDQMVDSRMTFAR